MLFVGAYLVFYEIITGKTSTREFLLLRLPDAGGAWRFRTALEPRFAANLFSSDTEIAYISIFCVFWCPINTKI
jgi:hypothetical protein